MTGVLRTQLPRWCRFLRATTPGCRRRARGQVRAMTATIDRTTTKERVPSLPARLSLTPAGSRPGLLDGAWWPRSRDLSRKFPALTDVLDARWGRITRITVNPAR